MASAYTPNKWELYNPNIPKEDQPHSFITKRKLEHIEKGIETASVSLVVGEITMGDTYNVTITEDEENKVRKLNITFPPAGKGDRGDDGKSAYQTWLDLGNEGSEQEFLDYLKGADGKDGKDGKDGLDGEQGPAGESAYQAWLNLGNTGSEQDFLNTLKGEKGEQGESGTEGKSAYQEWLDLGNTGSEEDFIMSLTGPEGKSAYEVWKTIPGNENKLITDFFESLKGEPGPAGTSVVFVDFI